MALSKPSSSKRKYEDDISVRNFNKEWEEIYLFTNHNTSKPACLICGFYAVPKKYNIERHFTTNHSSFNARYPLGSSIRSDFIRSKKNELSGQQKLFSNKSQELTELVRTSYEISLVLAKNKKPYSDGETVIKPCLQIFSKHCGDGGKLSKIVQDISLSRNTVTRRIDDMAENVQEQIISGIQSCKYFSLALDESCDMTDSAQLSIFVRYINDQFQVTEELLGLRQLIKTRGEDLFEEIKSVVEKNNLDWSKLNSICTDGAPAMTGKNNGCVALIEKFLGRKLAKYHCIIHRQHLCAKDLGMLSVLGIVVRCINKIRARALNRREFRNLFSDEVEEEGELLLQCTVRWLSNGKALERFWSLKSCVLEFLESIDELPADRESLINQSWLFDLAFLTDIMGHLNNLNLTLQGKNMMFNSLHGSVKGFMKKLQLFERHLNQNKLIHFTRMQELVESSDTVPNFKKFSDLIVTLQNSFQERFDDLENDTKNLEIFTNPFAIPIEDIETYSPNIQLEIIEIQNNTGLKNKYTDVTANPNNPNYIDFWKFVSKTDFPHLYELALQYTCRFGSTYVCEQAFSIMKIIKNKYRSSLTDDHLRRLILLATSQINPNIEDLVKKVQHQKSH